MHGELEVTIFLLKGNDSPRSYGFPHPLSCVMLPSQFILSLFDPIISKSLHWHLHGKRLNYIQIHPAHYQMLATYMVSPDDTYLLRSSDIFQGVMNFISLELWSCFLHNLLYPFLTLLVYLKDHTGTCMKRLNRKQIFPVYTKFKVTH